MQIVETLLIGNEYSPNKVNTTLLHVRMSDLHTRTLYVSKIHITHNYQNVRLNEKQAEKPFAVAQFTAVCRRDMES
jgi:hypothetical protein